MRSIYSVAALALLGLCSQEARKREESNSNQCDIIQRVIFGGPVAATKWLKHSSRHLQPNPPTVTFSIEAADVRKKIGNAQQLDELNLGIKSSTPIESGYPAD